MIAAARQWAFDILVRVATERSFANLSLQDALGKGALSDRDRALCTSLVYGTLQRQRSLDAILQTHLSRPIDGLEPRVLAILRMTAYQVLYLDKIPGYAAVSDAVELCKSVRPKAAGLVNAVMRALLRDRRPAAVRLKDLTASVADWAERAAVIHSYPTWLVRRLEQTYGRSRTCSLLEACNEPPALSARVNRLRATRAQILSEFVEDGAAQASVLSPDGIRFRRGLDVGSWEPYLDGLVSVQDEGAMVIAPLLQAQAGERILDMCAAPGGKTAHIAELQGDAGDILACDVHAHKVRLIEETASRLGLASIKAVCCDARTLTAEAELQGAFDAILLDAPCSGFGVLRHRPEIRWQRTEADVLQLTKLQQGLLAAAAELVRPGGRIVYSTCTMLPEENEGVVRAVIETGTNALAWDDITGELPPLLVESAREQPGQLLLMPDLYGTDGFYMARLRKKET
ncbi:16S rRNA (cytosine(967)-C(5))-methyltransferase RsmB [Alicyclobacillus cycloheptanicus]|uniref:16S rRNA (cytosine(967)-C(5))-methyltransferase n=1 Tax=Alicyclobacillus cycloheptanicus TaxID=1457 RepID=A0ABT9XKL7_9BACL|nr:16S rRNA (cytosine(967)-C(5))-methyltransferase RsmB [Alicyclobacillus cycloheptanicus]MDQ0190839.1 16S rRNA (cytosine967-C5)-methyltransferase [Alicyclobacillus cycloheptanicus]WDM01461.1 16S rRNA (cytosine(967)-C(5))-methyltransferase RsmB [Alicyclobacillus cycloheptanicus]